MGQMLPEHGWCFVCGSQNPHSMGLRWWVDERGQLTSEFTLTKSQQGPPEHAHGGASAAILDEAMGLVIWAVGLKVAAVHLELDYRKPLPLDQPLHVEARIRRRERRKIFSWGEIQLPNGDTAVSGRGIYVIAPKLFGSTGLPPRRIRGFRDG